MTADRVVAETSPYVGWLCPVCGRLTKENHRLRVCCFLNATAVTAEEAKAKRGRRGR